MKHVRILPSVKLPLGAIGVSLLLVLASALPAYAVSASSSARTAKSSPTAAEVQDYALKTQTEQDAWKDLA